MFQTVWKHRVGLALVILLALAFSLRTARYLENRRPLGNAGLAAEQAEMARNIVDDRGWFVLNPKAYELLKQRQAEKKRLVDVSEVDFSQVDQEDQPEPVSNQMPGVSVVLAALWWPIGNMTYSAIQWLQILLDSAMVFLVYWIARRLTQRTPVALMAALLYAVWPRQTHVPSYPILDAWAIWFTIGCVAAFIWAREQPTNRSRLVLLGVVTGIGIYFRPFVVFLPVALALVATPGGRWKRKGFWITVPTVIALLFLSPWTIRNYYEFHRFIPTRTGLGQAIFEGTGQASSDEHTKTYVQRHNSAANYGSPEYDDTLLSGAFHAIADDPWAYLRLIGRRAAHYLLPCLLVLLAWRRWRSAALVLVAAIAAVVVPYIFIGGAGAFYLPAFFAYFILLAMATDVVLSRLLRSRFLSGRVFARVLPTMGAADSHGRPRGSEH